MMLTENENVLCNINYVCLYELAFIQQAQYKCAMLLIMSESGTKVVCVLW